MFVMVSFEHTISHGHVEFTYVLLNPVSKATDLLLVIITMTSLLLYH